MLADFHLETLLATGYALLLLVIAAGLEMMGRHSHKRAGEYHHRGFRFHKHAVDWEWRHGARRERAESVPERRGVRWRAPAHTCNGCPIKAQCTDSDSGRELAVSLDPWLSTAIGQFHRAISLALLILAALIMADVLVRQGRRPEPWVLSAAVATLTLLALNVARGLRADSRG
jgi:hypothetical protein